ncbi:uncharacterized protein LOC130665348 [Microplitis mediator]|uniref:uncharacterized protein LOC130665348 n=1 Tax=Microplitis mediator TaxID=375433 RepID=UPI002552601F|nr:uncharacterized protein LOC130665348 [Microplitis mediator]
MLTNNPVVNFESSTLKEKIESDINNSLTSNIIEEIGKSPYTYNLGYEQFIKNLYVTIIHSMVCDADLISNRIKFSVVDIPLIEPIILVEDDESQLLHVLSRSLMRRIFHHKGNLKIISSDMVSSTSLVNDNNNNNNDKNSSHFSPTKMLKLKDDKNYRELNEDSIYLSSIIQEKLLLCYVTVEHAAMHYCQYILNGDNPDYEHNLLEDIKVKRSKHIFLHELITTKESRTIDRYLGK